MAGWIRVGMLMMGICCCCLLFLWVIVDSMRDHTVSNLTTATTATSYFIKIEE